MLIKIVLVNSNMKITSLQALQILDSRGQPTIQVSLGLESGLKATASVPSGASTGSHEAKELRDGGPDYQGLGVSQAISNITEKIAPRLIGLEVQNQAQLDQLMIELDGTADKSNLGANAILGVSLAIARAGALGAQLPLYEYLSQFNPNFSGTYTLPIPMLNVLNGGEHANWSTDIQEYMIMPVGAQSFAQALKMGAEIYQHLKKIIKEQGDKITVGDEGGFAPAFKTNEEAFSLLSQAILAAGYQLGTEVVLAIDAAASEFYQPATDSYELKKEAKSLSRAELSEFYQGLIKRYPLWSLEDPFAEDDWTGFKELTAALTPPKQIVGDDLYVTNSERLARGIAEQASNSILIKPNQIGTLTETIKTINEAQAQGLTAIISHRSGETEDTFIADLAVAMGTGQIKTGAPARSERTAKYNRLLAIEQELGERAVYAKFPFFP
jgi:enolase